MDNDKPALSGCGCRCSCECAADNPAACGWPEVDIFHGDFFDQDTKGPPEQVRGGMIEYNPNGPIPMFNPPEVEGTDPDWMDGYERLLQLHKEKSARYGNDDDRLNNLTMVKAATGKHGAYYPTLRIIEKCQRVLELLDAGEIEGAEEFLDISGLALCAEAMAARESDELHVVQ